eukprot:m.51601 g.51601  ORF g.51601 m.51601 type:complete len:473 (-) comp48323_c1_seq12:58-1476(-)
MCCSVCVDVVIMSCLCVCRCRTCAHVSVRLVGQCFQDSLISFGSTEYSADLRMERLKNALHGGLRGPPSADFLRYIEEHQLTCLYLLNEHLQTTGQKIPPGLNAVQFGKLKLWLSGHASRSKVHSLLQSDDFHNIAFAFTLDDSLLIRLFPDAPLHHLLTDTLTDDFDAITRRNIYALRDASTQPIGQPLSSGTSSPRSLTRSPPSTGTGSFSPASAHSRSGAAHVYTPPQVVSFSKPSETSHPSSPSVGGSPHSPSSASASTSARTSTAEFPVSPQYTAAVQTPFVPVVPVPEPPRPARLGQDDEISAEIEDLIENHLEYKWTETDRTMEMLRADHQKKFDAERFRLEGEYADAAEQFRRTEQQLNDRLRRQHEIFQLEQQVMQTDYEVVRDGFVKVEDNSSFTWLPLSIVRRFTEHTVADGSILSLPVDLEPLAAIVDYLRDNRMTSALRHCTDARRVWAELGIQEAFPL